MRAHTYIQVDFTVQEPPVSGDEVDYLAQVYVIVDTDVRSLEFVSVEEMRREYPTVGPWLEVPYRADLLEAVRVLLEESYSRDSLYERARAATLEDDPNLDD